MPCVVRLLTPAGLAPVTTSAQSLADAAQHEPVDGVYTVTNTHQTFKVVKLGAHLDRLEDSARRAGIPLQLDRARLRAALRQMIAESGFADVRFRVTVPARQPDQLILSIEPFTPLDPRLIAEGVRCVTLPDSARHDAAIKDSGWLHQRRHLADTLPHGVYEGLLLDARGYVLEGLSSNFYALHDDTLFTAGEGVLAGIARQIVLEVAAGALPMRMQPVHRDDLPRLAEAFITSSSRGIVPVVEIDGQAIGDGAPGPRTRSLRARYTARLDDLLEPL